MVDLGAFAEHALRGGQVRARRRPPGDIGISRRGAGPRPEPRVRPHPARTDPAWACHSPRAGTPWPPSSSRSVRTITRGSRADPRCRPGTTRSRQSLDATRARLRPSRASHRAPASPSARSTRSPRGLPLGALGRRTRGSRVRRLVRRRDKRATGRRDRGQSAGSRPGLARPARRRQCAWTLTALTPRRAAASSSTSSRNARRVREVIDRQGRAVESFVLAARRSGRRASTASRTTSTPRGRFRTAAIGGTGRPARHHARAGSTRSGSWRWANHAQRPDR